MAKYTCERCGATEFTTNAPHLCKDIQARLRRREKQVQAVLMVAPSLRRDEAEEIVKKILQMGVE